MSPKLEFEDEREEEEALSFSNLPITEFIRSNGDEEVEEDKNVSNLDDFDFDFDFGFEMCSADEVISGGQLLPFRHSVSSETGLINNRNSNSKTVSRSDSMDRIGFCSRSGSSRSSSIRSQYSSTSSTSTSSNNTSISVKTIPIPKGRNRNNYFHSHPSPKPQVWATGARAGPTVNNYSAPISKKSTMWDVLRLGLVRAPEIELQDLKQRHRLSNSGKTSFIMPRNTNSHSNNDDDNDRGKISELLLGLQNKKNNGGFFKSCKCSVLAIEPIHTREFGTKINYFGTKVSKNNKFVTNYGRFMKKDEELAEKRVILQEQEEQKQKEKIRQEKKVMSHHHRTFEWLRDLSHANVLNS
ncbi:hypothetical protein RND81_13G192700 [Saponaria officinalis]|uniref:Uncharacterized protein n=1 Tax=Saponaria officinalis TaxID=3572 RepID=A0AAW1H594_SAPOF